MRVHVGTCRSLVGYPWSNFLYKILLHIWPSACMYMYMCIILSCVCTRVHIHNVGMYVFC